MQDLFYIQASSSLLLVKENGETYNWEGINILISASAYDTIDSGSTDFGTTVGDIRISAYSGSTLVATFPIENTNIYYNSPILRVPEVTSSIIYDIIYWNFNTLYATDDLSGCSIYDNTLSSSYLSISGITGSGMFGNIISNNTYSLYISGSSGSSYDNYLYLNNITSGSIIYALSASSIPISASFVPLAFNNYEVTFSVVYSAP